MKKLTQTQIKDLAQTYSIEYAALRAVIEVEASGSGFVENLPKILYEPHIMYRLLTKKNCITIRNNLIKAHPDLCYPKWSTRKYGKTSQQHHRLSIASQYD